MHRATSQVLAAMIRQRIHATKNGVKVLLVMTVYLFRRMPIEACGAWTQCKYSYSFLSDTTISHILVLSAMVVHVGDEPCKNRYVDG